MTIHKYINVMIDLETLGKKPGCKILSIGACTFGGAHINDKMKFYRVINRAQPGLVEDISTVDWWEKQALAAQKELFENSKAIELIQALRDFEEWLLQVQATNPTATIRVWGNSASFDLKILEAAYMVILWSNPPWSYRNEMCYRTLKNLFQSNFPAFKGTPHIAIDDAVYQAEIAEDIFDTIFCRFGDSSDFCGD